MLDPVTKAFGRLACWARRRRRSAGCRVRPGHEGGDKFGRLPGQKRGPRQAVVLGRKTENPVKNEVFGKSGTWPFLRTFSVQKRAVTKRWSGQKAEIQTRAWCGPGAGLAWAWCGPGAGQSVIWFSPDRSVAVADAARCSAPVAAAVRRSAISQEAVAQQGV